MRDMNSGHPSRSDLAQITFGVLVIGLLLGACLWILRPFLGPGIWAAMIAITTWPVLQRVQTRLWGRRWLAVAAMTLALLLLFVVPLILAIVTLVGNIDQLVAWAKMAADYKLPSEAPQVLLKLPMVGGAIDRFWQQAAALGLSDLVPRLSPHAGKLAQWLVGELGNVGLLALQFMLTVLLTAVMWWQGEAAAQQVRLLASKLAGGRGDTAVVLAGQAIRGVALGVGLTALIQAALAGAGLWVAGVPFSGLLAALMLLMCLVQIGVLPVMLVAAGWVFHEGQTGAAIALGGWAIFVAMLDNFIRPVLIKMGADLPLILIFAGVIGGLFAFGLVGVFVGPVILAVGHALMDSWLNGTPPVSGPTTSLAGPEDANQLSAPAVQQDMPN